MLDTQGRTNIALVKFTPDGAHVWSREYKSMSSAFPSDLEFGPDGELAIVGQFRFGLNMGGAQLTSGGDFHVFVAKIDGAGAHVWSRHMGHLSDQYATGVGMDDDGNVLIGGGYEGAMDPGLDNGLLLGNAGGSDMFLVKLDSDGDLVWAKRFGDGDDEIIRSLDVDGQGNVVVAGEVVDTSKVGGGTFTVENTASFVAKYDNAGNHLWSKPLSDGDTIANAVAVDGLDNVLVTGKLELGASFGGNLLWSYDEDDAFVVKLTPSGAHVWSKRLWGGDDQWGNGIAVSLAGNVAVCGQSGSGTNFGSKFEGAGDGGFVGVFGP